MDIIPQTSHGLMIVVDWNSLPTSTKQTILDALSRPASKDIVTPQNEEADYQPESYPINVPQIRQLLENVDEKVSKFLEELARRYDAEKFDRESCWIDYAEAWEITGAKSDAEFGKGILSALHRRLGTITGDKVKLVLKYAKGGIKYAQDGSDGDGSYYIDSRQAVLALREYYKIR